MGRTVVLSPDKVRGLGSEPLLRQIPERTGRKETRLMIYGSVEVLNKRGANIRFDLN